MLRNPALRSRLQVESLESRDVPAIFVDGTLPTPTPTAGMPPVPNGGTVTIQEVALTATDTVINQPFTAVLPAVTTSATANDSISLTVSGTTLTITNSDGVYVRFPTTTGFGYHSVGTTLNVANVSALNASLQLGGNDTVTDNSMLTATINTGPGNDTVTAMANTFPPQLVQLFLQPGGVNPALFPLLGAMGGAKTIQGGADDDSLTGPLLGFFNQLDGGDGNDTIIGGFGPDILTGGNGVDVLIGFGGGDFYLTVDFNFDYLVNQRGDTVVADPFDVFTRY